jgi:acyl carrier protein
MDRTEDVEVQAFLEELAELLKVGPEQLVPDAHFEADLEVDSLGFVEVGALCAAHGVVLTEDELVDLVTVGDLLTLLQSVNGGDGRPGQEDDVEAEA